MQAIARRTELARLRRRITDIERREFTGLSAADDLACGPVSLAPGAVHEFRAGDYRDAPAVLGLVLALAGAAGMQRAQPVIWIGQTRDAFHEGVPYGCGLHFYGVDSALCIFVHARDAKAVLWAAEEAARHDAIVLVEFWKPHRLLDLTATRRLQLGAEGSGARLFLLRDARDEGPSAARTRWRVAPAPSAQDPLDQRGLGRPRWDAALEKSRDGDRGRWVLEWDHEQRSLIEAAPDSRCVVSAMADRPSEKDTAVA
ncbi:ImuA family protein [Hyphococcus sp.]|uniref:ImuA family protein n=2 Tax=Hyphococcus sp. TaxID=2038636 RepID=UPI0035C7440C